MKTSARALSKCSLAVCILGVVAFATASLAQPRAIGCKRDIDCPDVWDPVICDNGQVYSNFCYAYRVCATGCVHY